MGQGTTILRRYSVIVQAPPAKLPPPLAVLYPSPSSHSGGSGGSPTTILRSQAVGFPGDFLCYGGTEDEIRKNKKTTIRQAGVGLEVLRKNSKHLLPPLPPFDKTPSKTAIF
jgi:hypothetical protein